VRSDSRRRTAETRQIQKGTALSSEKGQTKNGVTGEWGGKKLEGRVFLVALRGKCLLLLEKERRFYKQKKKVDKKKKKEKKKEKINRIIHKKKRQQLNYIKRKRKKKTHHHFGTQSVSTGKLKSGHITGG